MKKSFLIVGVGSFGNHLCKSLAEQGAETMIVDKNPDKVEALLPIATSGKIGDCTNPEVLRSFGVADFDACFVCIGEDFHNSLVVTDILKELGAKKIFSEATQEMQEKFLRLGGADHVVFPEKDIAYRLAVKECCDSIFDFVALAGDYGIFEIATPSAWVDKTPRQLNLRANYNLNILASRRDQDISPMMSPDYRFDQQEHLLVMGHIDDVKKLKA
ncbi:MAG: TrkA family potassium uptake protein [Ruminococcaceae bacterium]|nr:TrkA family potassium uptake protein [Oscillospiraceae bacterium]